MGWEKVKPYTDKAERVFDSKWMVVILALLVLVVAFSVRIAPADLPVTDGWAEQTIQNNYVSQAEAQIRSQFPNLPEAQAREQAIREYQQFAAENAEQLAQQRAQLSQEFKRNFQFEIERPDGSIFHQTYLSEIDPYHYLQHAERILETGTPCSRIVDGRCWNDHSMAPIGTGAPDEWHTWVTAFFAWVAIALGFTALTGVYFMPAILGALVTIPTFFFVRMRFGSVAGAVAGLIVGLHTAFLPRTVAGFSSTDAWNILFPMFIIWFVALAFEEKTAWKSWLYIGLAGLLSGVYEQFWNGWWYTFFVMMAVIIAVGAYKGLSVIVEQYKKEKKSFNFLKAFSSAKNSLLYALAYIGVTGIVVSLTAGPARFLQAFIDPFRRTAAAGGLQSVSNPDLWPNVMRTVAELNPLSVNSAINNVGGPILFFVATMGLLVTMLRTKELERMDYQILAGLAGYYIIMLLPGVRALETILYLILYALPFIALAGYNLYAKESPNIHYAVIGAGWMVAGLFTITQGVRFQLLLLPAIALGVGFFVGWLMQLSIKLSKEQFEIPSLFARAGVVAIAALLLFAPVGANLYERSQSVVNNHAPLINDAWWGVLEDIRDDSEPDAIITSWWDFGHWFKYVADRGVNFDGSRQNNPPAHWVGNLLLSDDNLVSIGTIRLMNCGGNEGYNTIRDALEGDHVQAYHVIDSIRALGTADARQALQDYGFSDDVVEQTLEYTHCEPPESYLIVSEDMIGKAPVWGHFGGWDFDRAHVHRIVTTSSQAIAQERLVEEYGYSAGEAASVITSLRGMRTQEAAGWVSPFPQYAGTASCTRGNETSTCRLGLSLGTQDGVQIIADRLVINESDISQSEIVLIAGGQAFPLQPGFLSVDGEAVNIGGDFPIGISVDGSQAIIADDVLVNSLFTQLFIHEEPGPYFTELTRDRQITGGNVIVYKVNWEAYFAEVE